MSDSSLIDTLTAAAEELEVAETQADMKSAELAGLRERLWKLLGPPPGTITGSVELVEGAGCSNCVPVGKSGLIKELESIKSNIDKGCPNAAWGRAAALITVLREGGCRA